MSLRIHELAKRINMEGDALLALLKARNWVSADTRSVSSTVSKIYIEEIEKEFAVAPGKKATPEDKLIPEPALPRLKLRDTGECAVPNANGQKQLTRSETLRLYREEIKRMTLAAGNKTRRRKASKRKRRTTMLQGGSPGSGKRA